MQLGVVVVNSNGEVVADENALDLLGCGGGELKARLAPLVDAATSAVPAGCWQSARLATPEGMRTLRFSAAAWAGEDGAYRILLADEGDFDGLVTHIRQSSRWRTMALLMPTLTHGVRAPLNGIVVNAELLKELSRSSAPGDELASERRRRSLEALERSVAGLRSVMETLTANLNEPTVEALGRVDLRDVVQEVAALTKPFAVVKRAAISFDVGSQPAFVDGVRPHLRHALLVLVLNAIEAAAPADEVSVALRTEGAEHVACVTGNPAGAAAEILSRLAAPPLGAEGDGVAVRLYVARSIAEGHGGELIAEDAEAGRSRVSLRLPAAPEGR